MSTPSTDVKTKASILNSKLLWRIALPIFLSILTIELISLYPITKIYEAQKRVAIQERQQSQESVHSPELPLSSSETLIPSRIPQALLQSYSLALVMLTIAIAIILTGVMIYILRNTVLKPMLSIKDHLFNANHHLQSAQHYQFQRLSSNEFGEIERNINELLKRFGDAQRILKAHDSLLDLRVEERTKELSQMANYDPLTELPNRNLLQETLTNYIEQAKVENKNVALLTLSLNDFHELNNAYGADIGNQFLKKVARELTENTPTGSCVAHISTSVFAIARGGLTGTHQIANLAQWIIDLFIKPILINEQNLLTSVNIGIALFPIDGTHVDSIISDANLALTRAKNALPNTYQFYESNMNKMIEARRKMLIELHYALERNELVAYYQPQIELKTNALIGVEALLRWMHPEKGLIPPGFFIPLAEESGLIIPMSEWMLKTACKQGLMWKEQGLPPLTMAVNLSGKQFKQKNVVEVINRALIDSGLPPAQLEVEITESIIVDNIQEAISTMKALRGLGLSISIDDFGTGYSSLSYLSKFPVQKLKIDQSFVREIGQPGQEEPLADIILLLGKNLKLRVIAEGIETEAQAQYLRERGCHEGQGYLFGKPMPAEDIVKLYHSIHKPIT